jgi:hypothetical protein
MMRFFPPPQPNWVPTNIGGGHPHIPYLSANGLAGSGCAPHPVIPINQANMFGQGKHKAGNLFQQWINGKFPKFNG